MKALISIFFGFNIISLLISFPSKNKYDLRKSVMCSGKIVSSEITFIKNDSLESLKKCYGYAFCTACTTCSYCKHCNSGGSCGVCSNNIPPPHVIKEVKSYYSKEESVKLRQSASVKSGIIITLYKNQKLTYLDKSYFQDFVKGYGFDFWYKVKTESHIEGWVYGKLISELPIPENNVPVLNEITSNQVVYINFNNVNLRSEPSLDYSFVIAKLNYNDRCEFLGKKNKSDSITPYGEYDWYHVKFGNYEGWVFGYFISEVILSPNLKNGVVNAKYLNVRLEPGLTSKIMGRIFKNEKCLIFETKEIDAGFDDPSQKWFRITSEKNEGWVLAKFLDVFD